MPAMEGRRVPHYELSDLVRLNVMVRTVESELQMRYLSNPGNLDAMLDLLKEVLMKATRFIRAEDSQCPMGTIHIRPCLCNIKHLDEIDYFGTRIADWKVEKLELTDRQKAILYEQPADPTRR